MFARRRGSDYILLGLSKEGMQTKGEHPKDKTHNSNEVSDECCSLAPILFPITCVCSKWSQRKQNFGKYFAHIPAKANQHSMIYNAIGFEVAGCGDIFVPYPNLSPQYHTKFSTGPDGILGAHAFSENIMLIAYRIT